MYSFWKWLHLLLFLKLLVEEEGDEQKDCENKKGGNDLKVNDKDLDEMYDMYVHIQPVEGNFNNKRKLSEEDTQTSCKKRKT